jgi:uncharacterized membrane protein
MMGSRVRLGKVPKLKIKRYLVAGLLVWFPLGVTFLTLRFLVNVMDQSLLLVPGPLRPENLIGFRIPGLGVILTFVVLFATGALAANFFGKRLIEGWERLLSRIPLVSWVYSGVSGGANALVAASAGFPQSAAPRVSPPRDMEPRIPDRGHPR